MQKRPQSVVPAAVAAFVLLTLYSALPLGAQMPEPPMHPPHEPTPAITVTGSGQVRIAPDEAVVRLGVVAQKETAQAAQQEASRVARGILEAVAAQGVPEAAVQTSQLVLTPVYQHPNPRQMEVPTEPRIIGYRASNVVSVRLEDLTKIGPVIDAGIGAGANQVEGVHFQLQDDRAAREEALRKAVAEARSKAAAMAEALGVTLGPLLEAHEAGVSIERPEFAQMRMMAMDASVGGDTPVAAGELTVTGNVTLRYRIGG
jgi:hypothetical protein